MTHGAGKMAPVLVEQVPVLPCLRGRHLTLSMPREMSPTAVAQHAGVLVYNEIVLAAKIFQIALKATTLHEVALTEHEVVADVRRALCLLRRGFLANTTRRAVAQTRDTVSPKPNSCCNR